MRPIVQGARGPAVEDIQKRLLRLGYDLGPTGVDGVFLGKTSEAIASFQAEYGLSEDSTVGDETWSALVDATFTLGDRMLYLRLPHFHGFDVSVLQTALGTLGFSCGEVDGIFGRNTEQAVREFQRNCGQAGDGIVGAETVRALYGLRHVWEGKEAVTPVSPRGDSNRAIEPLLRRSVSVSGNGPAAGDIARRLVNVAHALDDRVCVRITEDDISAEMHEAGLRLALVSSDAEDMPAVPRLLLTWPIERGLTGRFITAVSSLPAGNGLVIVVVGAGEADEADEERQQKIAVALLDALCAALA